MVLFNLIKEGEYGLLNPLTRKLHRVNETGRFIWEACKEARDTEELVPMVAAQFEVPEEIARKDVEEFVDRMVQFQLFEV